MQHEIRRSERARHSFFPGIGRKIWDHVLGGGACFYGSAADAEQTEDVADRDRGSQDHPGSDQGLLDLVGGDSGGGPQALTSSASPTTLVIS